MSISNPQNYAYFVDAYSAFLVVSVLFERKALEELRFWVGRKAVVVVTGMRQVGKTTLLKMLFNEIASSNKAFFDLENPVVRRIFSEPDYDSVWANLEPHGIVRGEKAYLFLDELQKAPETVSVIKYLSDHYDAQFFVTGSSSFYLKNLFPESLAGRKVVLELFPLVFEEFLVFKQSEKKFKDSLAEKDAGKNAIAFERSVKLYDEFLEYGGFPGVVLAPSRKEKEAALDDVFTSYFEKDVKSLADFKEIGKLQDLIFLLLRRAGSKVSVSRLSSELELDRKTIYSYLSFLEATYFASLVEPFSRSADREVSGAKKAYVCDTGLLNRFAKVSSGALLENAVYNAVKRLGEVKYYQRRTGPEIDFVLPEQGVALEVKEKGTPQDLARLRKTAAELNLKEAYVVSKAFVQGKGFVCAQDL